MSPPANAQSKEKEFVAENKSEVDGSSAATKLTESEPAETTKNESVSDWLVMVCVLLCNVMHGMSFASYGVLYLPVTEMFESTRAAAGWIPSFDFALGSFLGELYSC